MKIVLILFSLVHLLPAQSFRIARPVPDHIAANGSYLFGEPQFGNNSLAHRGIDYLFVYDTVRSVSDGTVITVGYNPSDTIGGYEPGGCGNYLYVQSIWNGKNIYLLYCHLKKPIAAVGNIVTAGQPLAVSGTTGNSTGPHLHLEIRIGSASPSALRSRRNPELWTGMTGTGAIYGRIQGAANNTRVDISPDPKPRPPYSTFSYGLTYNFNDQTIGSDDVYQENYAIGDVKPGTYTIRSLNTTYVRTVTVKAGEVVNADATVSSSVSHAIVPNEVVLEQNFPNPFNPQTTISYSIPTEGYVSLIVYDLLGIELSTVVSEVQSSGMYTYQFPSSESFGSSNRNGIPSGLYFYRLSHLRMDGTQTVIQKKMLLVK